jgi:hypothetical protein
VAILESSDFGGSAPLYGFGSNWDSDAGTYFNFTRFTSGGPGDRAYISSTLIVVGDVQQFESGWNTTGLSSVSDGTSRFFRCRLRINSDFDATANGGAWTSKWTMIGDQGGANGFGGRIIAELGPRIGDNDCQLRVMREIGEPGVDGTEDMNLPLGEWISIQFEARAHPTAGYLKAWVNNDTYASPTSTSPTNMTLMGSHWTDIGTGPTGFYNNAALAAGGDITIDQAQVEYADTFDETWHATLGDSDPPEDPPASAGVYGVRMLRWR